MLPASEPLRPGGIALILAGFTTLIAALLILEFVLTIAEAYARSPWLGAVATLLFAAAILLLALGLTREVSALFALRSNQAWRLQMADPRTSLAVRKQIAAAWLGTLDSALLDTAELLRQVAAAPDRESLEITLREHALARLEDAAKARTAAMGYQVSIAKLLVHTPALEGLLFLFLTFRLLRRIAALYGLRPGLLAAMALYRRVLLDASVLLGVDVVATEVGAGFLAGNPMMRWLGEEGPGAALVLLRVRRFGRAAALECSPLPVRAT
jgi:putative membrane protein